MESYISVEFFEAVEGSKKRTNRINQERPTENLFFSPQDIYRPCKIKAKPMNNIVMCSLSMLVKRWGTFSLTQTFIMWFMIPC